MDIGIVPIKEMTLLDHFAGLAMSGLMGELGDVYAEATEAYSRAAAMMAAREDLMDARAKEDVDFDEEVDRRMIFALYLLELPDGSPGDSMPMEDVVIAHELIQGVWASKSDGFLRALSAEAQERMSAANQDDTR